ncbi:MAG: glycoside hydrolase family 3 C-terminal domain-containing protein [Firmicutes bacterium]|nr:glycoside hydrolase family 3 C-terminal domain-containing protein [Bacillota bacterium]
MDIKALVSQMTLEEKAGLCSGLDFWHTKPVERLGVPAVMVSDGPHGLRKQDQEADHLGINDSIKAVCMPAACATAASFDRDMIEKMGEAIGDSCQHEQLSVVLGPAVNIKRSPLCGRNFEYFSEDPYLAGEMSAAYINGVQSRNVGTSIKHFAANNQEHRRMSSSSNADERTLREIYLPAFETSVKKAQPWTVMCSYNRINGVYASENPWLLTDVLRKEWGFEGYVMSDWGAVSDRVAGLAAGLDLEMPASGGINDAKIVEAVRSGKLDEKLLDQAVERILTINYRYLENAKPETPWDMEAQHLLSAEIAGDCMVLLKNEGVLPLKEDEEAAFIGEFAVKPRYQGGGSSHINSFKTTSAMEAAQGKPVIYAQGYSAAEDTATDEMIAEAVAAAKKAKVAVVFAGLPDSYESEGYDRTHMQLPACQNKLIEAVAQVNPNTVVVLHNGSPVEMPWIGKVKAVLEAYLGGQAVGLATVRVLYGEVNPSGHLPETFPVKLSDNPSYLFYGGEGNEADYREGVFVGYRYYDKKQMPVLFPFGYGLSYTTFAYSDLRLSASEITDQDTLDVTVKVTNTGSRFGKTVVQLYVGEKQSEVLRPVRELKGFQKVALQPGESKDVTFTLCKRAFAYWNTQIHDWHVKTGEFTIEVGQSSRDIDVSATVKVTSTVKIKQHYTMDSIFMDIMSDPAAVQVMAPLLEGIRKTLVPDSAEGTDAAKEAVSDEMGMAMLQYMPLRGALSFGGGIVTQEMMDGLLNQLNNL